MKPEIWGSQLWHSIHYIALGFPADPSPEDVRHFKNFFENLHQVIPCYKCSINYVKHLNERPLEISDLKDNKTLFKWTVDIHNIVNKSLNKHHMSHDAAWALYNNNSSSNNNNNLSIPGTSLLFLCLFIITILLLFIGFNCRKK
jgi:hypothetical protein